MFHFSYVLLGHSHESGSRLGELEITLSMFPRPLVLDVPKKRVPESSRFRKLYIFLLKFQNKHQHNKDSEEVCRKNTLSHFLLSHILNSFDYGIFF